MYVIGFDVNAEEKVQLECMARAGGGQYYTAQNAREFALAAKQVVKESQSFGFLRVTALRNEKPIPARVDIFSQGEKNHPPAAGPVRGHGKGLPARGIAGKTRCVHDTERADHHAGCDLLILLENNSTKRENPWWNI